MEIVRPSRWVAQPWRNGGGTTHEIVREGTSDTFTFRMSVADVARDGPFSLFAGIDRWIVLLEGCGFTLHGGGSSHTLEQPFAPHRFAGEEPIVCTLRDGPVRDLNVMAARDRLELAVEAVVVSEVRALAPPARATRGYVFVLAGPLLLEGARLERHDLAVRAALPLEIRGVGEALVIWSTPRAPG
ncbi:MAG: HutD family protein [Deltaproteobacteria bacterium]